MNLVYIERFLKNKNPAFFQDKGYDKFSEM